ncbi:NAD(P)/FAD-dependent oxidoreductase [Candidatus Uhrbacteria bacterium]|nr:NAD(P)/FAD-dependent oxidoreductase [Candidatus Uhrbacteria bacterium]
MKHHSTGALTPEQRAAQDARFKEGREYDYLFIGTGNSALTCAALLANAGKRVCMLEAHDLPGGYAHSFKMGDYHFCAQIHYIWGCAPGGRIYEFLKKIGLEKELTFELFDPKGYDHMALPDGKTVTIPYGYDQLIENIVAAYPDQRGPMQRFVHALQTIRREGRNLPDRKIRWWEIPLRGPFQAPMHLWLWLKNATLQDVFNHCGLSKQAQAVLIANAGDMMAPPNELSIFSFVGLFGGYNTGAYYPTKHFKGVIDRYAQFITDHGNDIYYETSVTKINVESGRIANVETANGKVFTATTYICNGDPQRAANNLIGRDYFPPSYRESLEYAYSPAGMMIYLGLKPGFDLRSHGFGKFNIWHLKQWDMNQMWKEQLQEHNFTNPWFFISTPALHTNDPSNTPPGAQNMEIATLASYEYFKKLQEKSYVEYNKEKLMLADRLLDLVQEHYIPNLRQHIAVKSVGTSTTNEDFCMAPFGTAYGSSLSPRQVGLKRLKAETPFPNLFWCNASSGFAGFHGTTGTGMNLYMQLTGDRFYDTTTAPTDDELVGRIRTAIQQKKELININL